MPSDPAILGSGGMEIQSLGWEDEPSDSAPSQPGTDHGIYDFECRMKRRGRASVSRRLTFFAGSAGKNGSSGS